MPRYRYIVAHNAKPDDPVCSFTLFTREVLRDRDPRNHAQLRVTVPDDMPLEKFDPYCWETKVQTPIKDLNPVAVVRFNGRVRTCNFLWPNQPETWFDILIKNGYYPTLKRGFLNKKQMAAYRAEREAASGQIKSVPSNFVVDNH